MLIFIYCAIGCAAVVGGITTIIGEATRDTPRVGRLMVAAWILLMTAFAPLWGVVISGEDAPAQAEACP